MIELVQFPWSPFCIVQRRILEYSGARFRVVNIPNPDRRLVWRLTRQRYYGVPVIKEGKTVVFELDEDTQVIAKYLDAKLQLGLFPRDWEGIQTIVWQYVEHEIKSIGFKLNDIYAKEFVSASDWLGFVRHKERKFGRGCLEQWRREQPDLLAELARRLIPFERMLGRRAFLLDDQPRFVDFDLYGMLANFLYSGHYALPAAHSRIREWHGRIAKIKFVRSSREKLHS